MKKLILSFFVVILSATYSSAQPFTNELGGSGLLSVMNTNYGYVPGIGFEIDHRLNFTQGRFSLKNSLGMTSYGMVAYDKDKLDGGRSKGQDYLWMFDIMGEFTFLSYRDFHRKTKNAWTPYIGVGANFIYRSTKSFSSIEGSAGSYITLKGSFGIKYKIKPNVVLNVEGNLDWDFSDDLDGLQYTTQHWYNYDHMGTVSVGLTYLFKSSRRGVNSHWSGT